MKENRLLKGMFQILSANILNLFFSMGTAFLLPKFLSLDAYSQIKTYQLYITYTALFHFGYNDGMILKYGGMTMNTLNTSEIQRDLSTARIFQSVMTGICMTAAFIIQDTPLFMAACAILPLNMIAYFRNLYQAVGEFQRYSSILNWTTILTFAINLLLVGVIKTEQYVYYLLGYVLLNLWIWGRLERTFCKTMQIRFAGSCFSWRIMKENIFSGFLLLTANLSSMLLTGIDRFFVKGLLGTADFAQYAFAASMENFLNVAVTPISVSLYNYFCVNDSKMDMQKIKELLLSFAALVAAGAFAVRFLLETLLPEYMAASQVLFLLFAAHIYMTFIKCFYVNLYKARKQQKKYSEKLALVIVLAVVLNILCFEICPKKEAIAVGTLLASIAWFLLCQKDFPDVKCSLKNYLFIGIQTVGFLLTGFRMNAIAGAIVYVIFTLLMIGLCMPKVYGEVRKIFQTKF